MGQSGWAASLVVLTFACSWILPLLTSLVAGDVFAAEDRLGTWRHLLVAVRSPQRIFAAKALASLTVIALLAVGLAASGIAGGLARGRQPAAGRPRRSSARAGAGLRRGPARLVQRAGADAGVRGDRAARLGGARPFSDGPGDPRAARPPAGDRAVAAAARRRAGGPAELRLHRLARAVHRPGPDRPGDRRHPRQPRLGGGRRRAGLPAVHAPRLHRPGLRRRRPPRARASGAAPGGAARRHGRGDRRRHAGLGLRDRQGQARPLPRHVVRPPLSRPDRPVASSGRHRGATADPRQLRPGRLPASTTWDRATTGDAW